MTSEYLVSKATQPIQIGTVEILRPRVYPLDSAIYDSLQTTVWVEPNIYPLYKDGLSIYWMMEGVINKGNIFRHGDGISTINPGDRPSEIIVRFPSRFFGVDDFHSFLEEVHDLANTPHERLRFNIEQPFD